jgi:hypothetical protein
MSSGAVYSKFQLLRGKNGLPSTRRTPFSILPANAVAEKRQSARTRCLGGCMRDLLENEVGIDRRVAVS